MEVNIITCDCCGRQIDDGVRIKATRQRIRRTTEYHFAFDLCKECFERIQSECKNEKEQT